jgi:signal transduction histidine kinase
VTWLLGCLAGRREDPQERGAAPARRQAFSGAALALAGEAGGDAVETVLQAAVNAVARFTGAGAVLAVVDADGAVERLAAADADGCARETLTRADVLGPLAQRLRSLGRPLGPSDVSGSEALLLEAVAPQGFVALPVGGGVRGMLVLIEPDAAPVLDETAVELASAFAVVAGEALAGIGRAAALRETCEDLRELTAHMLARRDRESEETAHELHEEVCQQLAAANAELQALEHRMVDDPSGRERVRGARRLVNRTIGDLREMAQRLRPAMLEDLGYVQALRWYTGRLRERTGVSLSLEVEGEDHRLPLAMESALYRATEEALAPAARRRSALRVSYRREPAGVQLEIAGSEPGAVELAAMRERLRPFRGTVRVTAAAADAAPVLALELPFN